VLREHEKHEKANWMRRRKMPLIIDFTTPTALVREQNRTSSLPIIGNGPPGTFVLFPHGFRVSLPTDQIIFADDDSGHVRVGFGGMQFVGVEQGRLVFIRIRELFPEDQLSPDRSHTMRLDPQWVAAISEDGRRVWPAESNNAGPEGNKVVDVECYAGYRAEETPRRFRLGEREIEIAEVLDSWLAPDHRYFKVQDTQNDLYILRNDIAADRWELTWFRRGPDGDRRALQIP
jgi:hypothetical protein